MQSPAKSLSEVAARAINLLDWFSSASASVVLYWAAFKKFLGLEWKDIVTGLSVAYNFLQHWMQKRAVEATERKTLLNSGVEDLNSQIEEYVSKAVAWCAAPNDAAAQAEHALRVQNLIGRDHVIGRRLTKLARQFPAFSSANAKLGLLRDAVTGRPNPPVATVAHDCAQIRSAGDSLLDEIEKAHRNELAKLPRRWWFFGAK